MSIKQEMSWNRSVNTWYLYLRCGKTMLQESWKNTLILSIGMNCLRVLPSITCSPFPLGPLGCLATQFGLAWFAASSDTGASTNKRRRQQRRRCHGGFHLRDLHHHSWSLVDSGQFYKGLQDLQVFTNCNCRISFIRSMRIAVKSILSLACGWLRTAEIQKIQKKIVKLLMEQILNQLVYRVLIWLFAGLKTSYVTPKKWTCPLKVCHFQRKCHFPTINFHGKC